MEDEKDFSDESDFEENDDEIEESDEVEIEETNMTSIADDIKPWCAAVSALAVDATCPIGLNLQEFFKHIKLSDEMFSEISIGDNRRTIPNGKHFDYLEKKNCVKKKKKVKRGNREVFTKQLMLKHIVCKTHPETNEIIRRNIVILIAKSAILENSLSINILGAISYEEIEKVLGFILQSFKENAKVMLYDPEHVKIVENPLIVVNVIDGTITINEVSSNFPTIINGDLIVQGKCAFSHLCVNGEIKMQPNSHINIVNKDKLSLEGLMHINEYNVEFSGKYYNLIKPLPVYDNTTFPSTPKKLVFDEGYEPTEKLIVQTPIDKLYNMSLKDIHYKCDNVIINFNMKMNINLNKLNCLINNRFKRKMGNMQTNTILFKYVSDNNNEVHIHFKRTGKCNINTAKSIEEGIETLKYLYSKFNEHRYSLYDTNEHLTKMTPFKLEKILTDYIGVVNVHKTPWNKK